MMLELKDRLYNSYEVANILRCNVAFVRYLARRKKIGKYRNGRIFLFSKDHILAYLKNNEVKGRTF